MTLTIGSKGSEVRKLQTQLQELGFVPGKADGIFGQRTRKAVMAFQSAFLVDGIADDMTIQKIEDAYGSFRIRGPAKLTIPVPRGVREVVATFGEIKFRDVAGGNIEITNDWDTANIARAMLPVVGTQLVHIKLVPTFIKVFQEIEDRGLDKHIHQFGCWCPRHKMHDPKRSLSTHSWGIAVDINWSSNMPGTEGDMPPEIVEVFKRYGFEWGGDWHPVRDPMHYQYAKGF